MGLTRDQFVVKENGVRQQIESIVQDAAPIRAGIMIDVSGSMGGRFAAFKEMAYGFIQSILEDTEKDNRVLLATFATRTRVLTDIVGREDRMKLERLFALLHHTDRGTSLYDGISTAVTELYGTRGKRAVIVFTDGRENASGSAEQFLPPYVTAELETIANPLERVARREEIVQEAQQKASNSAFERLMTWLPHSSVVVYVVQFSEHPLPKEERERLETITALTGGKVFIVKSEGEVQEAYDRIEEQLRTGYVVVYSPQEDCVTPCSKSIQVEVNDSSAIVHAPLSRRTR